MYDCVFPVVLAPVPPPKSVAADSGMLLFINVILRGCVGGRCALHAMEPVLGKTEKK
jgi:hypothetical protein